MGMAMNSWPFINGSYGASVLFLVAASVMTFMRYRRARKRLAAAEKL